MRKLIAVVWFAVACEIASTPAYAVQPDEVMADPAKEARARELSRELRCMVCQNQSIDDSDAPLARDLRILVRERLTAGDSDEKVLALTARVSIAADAAMDATFPRCSPARILVRAGGRSFMAEVPAHKGNVTRPLAREEIDAKLVGAATPAIGEARASEWTLALRGMAKAATIDALLRP